MEQAGCIPRHGHSPVAQNELSLMLFGTRAVSYDSLSTGSKRCDRKGFKWQNRGQEWGKLPVRSEELDFPNQQREFYSCCIPTDLSLWSL